MKIRKQKYKYVTLGGANNSCPACGKVDCPSLWHLPGNIERRERMKDETEKPQTVVHWTELNSSTEDSNIIKFYVGEFLKEVMRLDKDGMIYKGNRIEDAGEAHRAFLDVMKTISWKEVHELREANQRLEAEVESLREAPPETNRECECYSPLYLLGPCLNCGGRPRVGG